MYVYIYIYIYIYTCGISRKSLKVWQQNNKRQKVSYIFNLVLILLNNLYKYATLGRFYNFNF